VSALTELTLSGGAGNDTFHLLPQTSVTITVDGGPQPEGGADTLNFNAERDLVTQLRGQLQTQGKPPVLYTGIEIINLINLAYQTFLALISR
jgi:Ca2+-binding RTX toxin-like protein